MIAPIRLPPPLLRYAIAAAAATARSRFSQPAVPKSRLADTSTTSQVSSSRSAIICRTCGMRGARGHRPVHPADVVAGLVDPRLPRLGTGPGNQPEVVAVQHAVELAADRQLERAQRRRQRRVAELAALQRRQSATARHAGCRSAAAGLADRRRGPRTPDWPGAHRMLLADRNCAFTCGSATVCRMRLITVSAAISSASAS